MDNIDDKWKKVLLSDLQMASQDGNQDRKEDESEGVKQELHKIEKIIKNSSECGSNREESKEDGAKKVESAICRT